MIFEQHYLDCLSQAPCFIGDEESGRSIVVAPRRDIAPYLSSAAEHALTIDTVITTHFHADFLSGHLELAAVRQFAEQGAVVLDTRAPNEFATGHFRGSINIGLAGRYAEFACGVIDPRCQIVLVCEPGTELESKIRLARIGFDNVDGHLADPLRSFSENPGDVSRSSRICVRELEDAIDRAENLQLVDERKPGEVEAGIIESAVVIPLTQLSDLLGGYGAWHTRRDGANA